MPTYEMLRRVWHFKGMNTCFCNRALILHQRDDMAVTVLCGRLVRFTVFLAVALETGVSVLILRFPFLSLSLLHYGSLLRHGHWHCTLLHCYNAL